MTIPASSRPAGLPRVQSRLLRVFILQLALISLVTIAGVFAAGFVAEKILVNRALEGESEYYWRSVRENGEHSTPNTMNLHGYLSSVDSDIPDALTVLPVGQHRTEINGDEQIVYVSQQGDDTLYLLFQDETVSNLAFYFGVLPLTLVLLIMYGLAYLAFALSRRAVSPLSRLAATIETFDFSSRDASELDLESLHHSGSPETVVLAEAIEHFVDRTRTSIERERNFTRYASHELRTPVAVIQGSVSTLELLELDGAPARAVDRIKRTTLHMGELITALLTLSRDRVPLEDEQSTDVGIILQRLSSELTDLDIGKPVSINIEENSALQVQAPEAVVSIVLGNILTNAYHYTSRGSVTVRVDNGQVSVTDTGPGLNSVEQVRVFEPFYRAEHQNQFSVAGDATGTGDRVGYGLGLALVRQACDNYGWGLSVESEPGVGSTFTVTFYDVPSVSLKPVA